jgi:hypothetical protein
MSIALASTPDVQGLRACVPTSDATRPEIQGWNGTDVTIETLIGSDAAEDNRTSCDTFGELSCSFIETRTKTEREAEERTQKSRTQTAINPKETDSRLAQLGLFVALLGVISVVV